MKVGIGWTCTHPLWSSQTLYNQSWPGWHHRAVCRGLSTSPLLPTSLSASVNWNLIISDSVWNTFAIGSKSNQVENMWCNGKKGVQMLLPMFQYSIFAKFNLEVKRIKTSVLVKSTCFRQKQACVVIMKKIFHWEMVQYTICRRV